MPPGSGGGLPRAAARFTLATIVVLAAPTAAAADELVVTKSKDTADGACDADCSLREALIAADATPGADQIVVPEGVYRLELPGAGPEGGDLDVGSEVQILPQTFSFDGVVIDASFLDPPDRVLELHPGALLQLPLVTVRGGRVVGDDGGGLAVRAGARLEGFAIRVVNNSAVGLGEPGGAQARGGAIHSDGEVMLLFATLENNFASTAGGALSSSGSTSLGAVDFVANETEGDSGGARLEGTNTIDDSVFLANRSRFGSAALLVAGGSTTIGNSLIVDHAGDAVFTLPGAELSMAHSTILGSEEQNLRSASGGSIALRSSILLGSCTDQPLASGGGNLAAPGTGCGLVGSGDLAGVPRSALAVFPRKGDPAIDRGVGPCTATDYSGRPRPVDGDRDGVARCDSGAVEFDPCRGDDELLCIDDQPGDQRFEVRATFETASSSGVGKVAPLTGVGVDRGGVVSFFNRDNPELLVKILNACIPAFDSYWVFYSAATDQAFTLTVTDTFTDRVKTYSNPLGVDASPVSDVAAFPCEDAASPLHAEDAAGTWSAAIARRVLEGVGTPADLERLVRELREHRRAASDTRLGPEP